MNRRPVRVLPPDYVPMVYVEKKRRHGCVSVIGWTLLLLLAIIIVAAAIT